jgi:hypothetical protein
VIACTATGCSTTATDVGTLAAHLVEDHDSAPSVAFRHARRAGGCVTIPVTRPEPVAPPPPTERIRSTTPHRADPASCKVCARLAPEKCKRHGGASRSTSFRGRRGGTRLGVAKTAARRVGVSLIEYEQHVAAGEKWCYRCRAWHPVSAFGVDARRHDGLGTACRESKNRHERGLYLQRRTSS